jgi:DNA polymerase-1
MLLQVHDELVFETSEDHLEPLKDIVYEEMPNALEGYAEMCVPLKVDTKAGPTWGDME